MRYRESIFIEKKEGYNNKAYSLIYVSLNGVSNLDSISEQVLLAMLPMKASTIGYGNFKEPSSCPNLKAEAVPGCRVEGQEHGPIEVAISAA